MHFDLIDLRLFLNVLESGNITAGAARSHLSLASASARVRGLEASLNIALLERGRRGVTPTPAGKALAQHARLILQQVERMQLDLADYANGFKAGYGCCAIAPRSASICRSCWQIFWSATRTSILM